MSALSDLCRHYRMFWQECVCFCLNAIHFCLLLPPPPATLQRDFQSEERSVGGGGRRPRMCLNLYFAFRCLFCETPPIYLSEHTLGEMSEWYWQRRGELGGERTYCSVCTHPAHSILGNCSASKKKLSLFCHSVSQVTFTANNLTGGLKKKKKKEKGQKTGSLSVSHFRLKRSWGISNIFFFIMRWCHVIATKEVDTERGEKKRLFLRGANDYTLILMDFNGGILKNIKIHETCMSGGSDVRAHPLNSILWRLKSFGFFFFKLNDAFTSLKNPTCF